MKYPPQNLWQQVNNGNIFGTLSETQNVNFEQEGEVSLSRKAGAIATGSTANFGEVLSLIYFNNVLNVLTDEQMFTGTLTGTAFTATASSPTFTLGSDMLQFGSVLAASDDTEVHSWNGSAWTTGQITGLNASRPHPMEIFESQATFQLAVGDDNQVEVYNTSWTASGSPLVLPTKYRVTCMVYRNGFLYIGTLDETGVEARVFMWNGDGAAAQYSIPVGASWIFSMVPYKSTVAFVTNEGELLAVNGTGLQRLAAFPVYHVHGARWQFDNELLGKVAMNGMAVQGDTIYINTEGKVDSGEIAGMKSGIWRYDPVVGLHHYGTATVDTVVEDTGVTVATNVITTSAAHNLKTGDPIMFDNVSGLSGVSDETLYYAVVTDTDKLKVARSLKEANESNTIAVSGTVTTDELWYFPNTDYGNQNYARSGAIYVVSHIANVYPLFANDIIFGSETKDTDNAALETLCVMSQSFNYGGLTTQRIYSGAVESVWAEIYTYVSNLLNDNEQAIVKVQNEDRTSMPTKFTTVTWSDTDTFTCNSQIGNNIDVGDEIVFVEGKAQGRTAHVVTVSVAGDTTTITVDETIGTGSSTSVAYATTFQKVEVITNSRELENLTRTVLAENRNGWIKLKVELQGYEPRVTWFDLAQGASRNTV